MPICSPPYLFPVGVDVVHRVRRMFVKLRTGLPPRRLCESGGKAWLCSSPFDFLLEDSCMWRALKVDFQCKIYKRKCQQRCEDVCARNELNNDEWGSEDEPRNKRNIPVD